MQITPRIKMYGKKAPQERISEEIRNLLSGNATRPYLLTIAEIGKVLEVCRKTVYNYINRISKEDSISRLQSGHFFLPKSPESEFRAFNKHYKITSDQLVSEWMDDLLTRKQGNPVKCWKTRLNSLEVVCNTCQVRPREL
ncbi:MAG: helix-turn-helix domain-containing protein [Nitrosopumilus sp.]|nr:helix-turn-helix domain-containing protein [Nitrosopumilus sp.]